LRASGAGQVLPYDISAGDPKVLDFAPTFAAMASGLRQGVSPELLAASFHNTMAVAITDMVMRISAQTGIREVALSGGVFQNCTLLDKIVTILALNSFRVYIHRQVPPNDGGLALGQAVVAGERSR
jgi:hydrogenase maturation protein HypF